MTRLYPILAAAIAVSFAGCALLGQPLPVRTYYVAPSPEPPTFETTGSTLGIRPLVIERPFGTAMITREADSRLDVSSLAGWAEPPVITTTRAITDALRATGAFEDVGNAADLARPEFILTGELLAFYRDATTAPMSATVSIQLELRRAQSVDALWLGTVEQSIPLADDSEPALAEGLETALEQAANEAAKQIVQAVQAYGK